MKKLSLSLFLTMVALASAGTGTGCSSSSPTPNPGTGGSNANALVPNADGFFDGTNAAGILGAWYAYGDWYGNTADPSMPIAGMGDCPVKGGYTADQCSSIMTPTPGQPFSNTGGSMCTTGTVAKVVDMMYSAIWGAGIGFDLNNAGADGGTGKNAWDAGAHNVTGFSFHIDTPPTGGQMRVEFPTNAVPGTTDINAAYWGGASNNLSAIKNGGDYSFHWADVGGPMYLTAPTPFDKSKIVSMQFHVVANTSSSIPFMYCISNLTPLHD
jgi:hypothetical protein